MVERVNPLVRQYQNTLDSLISANPHLERCLAHCRHCGIRFLVDPRSAGRENLRCPFGCRQHYRKQRSNERSKAYYRTDSGRRKKELLNARRSGKLGRSDSAPLEDELPVDELPVDIKLVLDNMVLAAGQVKASPMLDYLRMVIRVVEGVEVTGEELVIHLLDAMRQHCMAYRTKADYVLCFLHDRPP